MNEIRKPKGRDFPGPLRNAKTEIVLLWRRVYRRLFPLQRAPLPPMPAREPDMPGKSANYGAILAELVSSAKSASAPAGYNPEYDLIRSDFDVEFYLATNTDVAARRLDPIAHYIRTGAFEGRDPAPWFSTKAYVARYPAVSLSRLTPFGYWVKYGKAKSHVTHPYATDELNAVARSLKMSPEAALQALNDRRNDLRDRMIRGKLGEMVRAASEIDPLVELTWTAALDARITPFGEPADVSRLAAQFRLSEAAEFRQAKAVIVVNGPRWGGGPRMEGHIAQALVKRYPPDAVVVISSDESGEMPVGRFPPGLRYVDFAGITPNLPEIAQQSALLELIRSLRPEFVFNVNSRLYWDTLASYEDLLKKVTHSVGVFFCNEQTPLGYWTGYPLKLFHRHFDSLSAVCTDSAFLVSEFRRLYQVSPAAEAKLCALPAPMDSTVALVPGEGSSGRPQVFWAGRFDRQKRLDLVYAIANKMPDVDFRLWGEPVMDGPMRLPPKPQNVDLLGKFGKFSELPLKEADLWLYTSEWDGVPALLLEVLMTGIPVVGSNSGGTGEVLNNELSWLIKDLENADAYCAAIEDVLADRAGARGKARRLRERLSSERSRDAFEAALFGMMDRVLGGPA